ncbi:MAG: hypothetical protein OEO79_13785 [Gemmatimonadota bacterium]|nr:hypothetical protein [Gemmatimonadota bacterium]
MSESRRTTEDAARVAGSLASASGSGEILRLVSPGEPDLHFRLFVPTRIRPNRPVFVAVHGISRNADEQAHFWGPLAERHGLVVVAPHFGADDFPDYQRLGRMGYGPRADLALLRAIGEVRSSLAIHSQRLLMFGYSGGGQFTHRFAMAYPKAVRAAVVAAAGWYTFPEPDTRYPLGLRVGRRLPGVHLQERALLRVPILTIVGGGDTERDASLRQSPRLDRHQGHNRVERALRWVAAMREAAARQGLSARIELQTIPATGHSFATAFEVGMGTAAIEFLRRRRRSRNIPSTDKSEEKANT